MANRIKAAHRKAIEEYVDQVRVALRLTDWTITLLDEPTEGSDDTTDPDELPAAQIVTRETHHFALLRIGDRFFDDDDHPDSLRKTTLIHEVLHLHFEYTWHVFLEVAHNSYAGQALTMAKYTFRCEIERAVDQLAWALAAMLPPFKLPA